MAPKGTEILNKDVFFSDPTTYKLPNDGVTKVGPLPLNHKDKQWDVARYELEHFVCEGSYKEGLSKILQSFLTNLDQDTQPAVWVSGFFGSGKSHLVRVLEFLWSDLKFDDGATARYTLHPSSRNSRILKRAIHRSTPDWRDLVGCRNIVRWRLR